MLKIDADDRAETRKFIPVGQNPFLGPAGFGIPQAPGCVPRLAERPRSHVAYGIAAERRRIDVRPTLFRLHKDDRVGRGKSCARSVRTTLSALSTLRARC